MVAVLLGGVYGFGEAAADDGSTPSEAAIESVAPACQAAPSDGVTPPDLAPLGFLPGERPVNQTWTCSYCQWCAGSLVNKACCFVGEGPPACVGSCTTGCQEGGGGEEFPEG